MLITFLVIYLIYSFNNEDNNYVLIRDNNKLNNYIMECYLVNNKKVNDLFSSPSIIKSYQDIKNNRTIKVNDNLYYFKKVLRESDVLVINVGMEELTLSFNNNNLKANYELLNRMYNDIEKLIKEIQKYAFGKIIFIGYYNPTNYYDAYIDELFYSINSNLEKLMNKNGIIYVDLYEKIKANENITDILKIYLD